jgi:hypothetical protein
MTDKIRTSLLAPAYPVEVVSAVDGDVLHPIRQSGPAVNITTSPTKDSTSFCPFGLFFGSEEIV